MRIIAWRPKTPKDPVLVTVPGVEYGKLVELWAFTKTRVVLKVHGSNGWRGAYNPTHFVMFEVEKVAKTDQAYLAEWQSVPAGSLGFSIPVRSRDSSVDFLTAPAVGKVLATS